MPSKKRYTFVISATQAQKQFTGFIDMLRYDGATVIESSDASMLVLQTTGHAPTWDRWASFGMYTLAQVEGDYPDTRALRAEAAPKLPL